ncbi:amino acid ABC transporter permease [Actinoplanes regularis]|uniref:Amino acid ABC transporter membrane protein 1, PAAT family n=1 Tax=Actinoplanes regularis TaxID=52697 RepID=A0A238V0P5_9ACTN|nr:amino acid ABC transporter permease [Actinoplanes regularis]GIE84226.1 amino acid ABC transporter permease [Actinoplanes regularis]GLW28746.1 amino acid ABC transporter permease [Actinoplanes regularis]SNR27089.1 amino acid ABC transporter membrane protein 1, PAAT family [Actinoplanes regularis]
MTEFLHVLTDHWSLFGKGFGNTVKLFLIAAVGSLLLGVLLGAFRVSPIPALRWFGATYVNIVRNTPLTLVFAFLVFAVPKLDVDFEYFTAAFVALTVYTAAFICEVVRAGVNTVPPGQAEAARALGLTFAQVLTQVVLPQALRSMVPPLMSVLIAMLKNTTVAAGFSVLEAGAIPAYMAEFGEPQFYVLLWIAIGFLVLITPLVLLQRFLERKLAVAR